MYIITLTIEKLKLTRTSKMKGINGLTGSFISTSLLALQLTNRTIIRIIVLLKATNKI